MFNKAKYTCIYGVTTYMYIYIWMYEVLWVKICQKEMQWKSMIFWLMKKLFVLLLRPSAKCCAWWWFSWLSKRRLWSASMYFITFSFYLYDVFAFSQNTLSEYISITRGSFSHLLSLLHFSLARPSHSFSFSRYVTYFKFGHANKARNLTWVNFMPSEISFPLFIDKYCHLPSTPFA